MTAAAATTKVIPMIASCGTPRSSSPRTKLNNPAARNVTPSEIQNVMRSSNV